MQIKITSVPSRSKGWGGYKVPSVSGHLIYSDREITTNKPIEIHVWNCCRTKSGKESKGQRTYRVRPVEGATCELRHSEGSQDTVLTVYGGEIVEEGQ